MTKQEAIEYIKSNYPDSQRYEGLCEALDIAMECIQKDMDEEITTKHGYWDGSECSVCHDDLSNYQYDMPNIVYPYCPFCGAEMDIEKK